MLGLAFLMAGYWVVRNDLDRSHSVSSIKCLDGMCVHVHVQVLNSSPLRERLEMRSWVLELDMGDWPTEAALAT